jgi:chromosomal replication initiator protein
MKTNKNILNRIEKQIKHHFGYDFDYLTIKSRKPQYSIPRQISMYLIDEYTELPHRLISSIFSIDRSNVCNSRKLINNLIETDKEYRDLINDIRSQLA